MKWSEVQPWTGVESVQEVLKRLPQIHPYTEGVVDVSLPEGRLEGLVLEETRLQGIHKEIHIGGGHLGAHGSALYLLVQVCMEGKDVVFEHYVKEGLHDVLGQRVSSEVESSRAMVDRGS